MPRFAVVMRPAWRQNSSGINCKLRNLQCGHFYRKYLRSSTKLIVSVYKYSNNSRLLKLDLIINIHFQPYLCTSFRKSVPWFRRLTLFPSPIPHQVSIAALICINYFFGVSTSPSRFFYVHICIFRKTLCANCSWRAYQVSDLLRLPSPLLFRLPLPTTNYQPQKPTISVNSHFCQPNTNFDLTFWTSFRGGWSQCWVIEKYDFFFQLLVLPHRMAKVLMENTL